MPEPVHSDAEAGVGVGVGAAGASSDADDSDDDGPVLPHFPTAVTLVQQRWADVALARKRSLRGRSSKRSSSPVAPKPTGSGSPAKRKRVAAAAAAASKAPAQPSAAEKEAGPEVDWAAVQVLVFSDDEADDNDDDGAVPPLPRPSSATIAKQKQKQKQDGSTSAVTAAKERSPVKTPKTRAPMSRAQKLMAGSPLASLDANTMRERRNKKTAPSVSVLRSPPVPASLRLPTKPALRSSAAAVQVRNSWLNADWMTSPMKKGAAGTRAHLR